MKGKGKIADIIAAALVTASILPQIFPLTQGTYRAIDTEIEAGRMGKMLEVRMDILEKNLSSPLFKTESIPSDMVVYRYAGDTLQQWINQFTIASDDIRPRMELPKLTNPRMTQHAPLADLPDSLSFCNFGPKWYLVKSIAEGNVKTICGLEIINTINQGQTNGVNRKLRLPSAYSVKPLSCESGTEVLLHGTPVFKVVYESLDGSGRTAGGGRIWISLLFFFAAVIIFVKAGTGAMRLWPAYAASLLSSITVWIWGRSAGAEFRIFSPELYADGDFFYSLGAILIINATAVVMTLCAHLDKASILERTASGKGRKFLVAAVSATSLLILVYSWLAIKSLILNSSIPLELHKVASFNAYSWTVYLSFLGLLACIPTMFSLAFGEITGKRLYIALYAAAVSAGLLTITSVLGTDKEESRLEIWANRLSVDRDIALELQLRRADEQISQDAFIASLLTLKNPELQLERHIRDNYFARISQMYDIRVLGELPQAGMMEPLAENSHFFFAGRVSGRLEYVGVFFYNIAGAHLRLAFSILQRDDENIRGYAGIAGMTPPGGIVIPSTYSYARYEDSHIITFKGNYAYPVELREAFVTRIRNGNLKRFMHDGYYHFFFNVAGNETVVISRRQTDALTFLTSLLALSLVIYLLLSALLIRNGRSAGKNYYKKRISIVLQVSLVMTLVVMAVVSVLFVSSRNESNLRALMADKINATRSMVQSRIHGVTSIEDLRSPEFVSLLEFVAANSNSDISVYAPSGRIFLSTSFMIFESGIAGCRMNNVAYDDVVEHGHRYFIQKEKFGNRSFYNMYAPIFGDDGKLIAIISSPYTEESSEFEMDALTHSAAIITLFLMLLLVSRIVVSDIVDKMFKPISEVGEKMKMTGLDSLEQIEYDRDDEVKSLVLAYNRMVTELAESSRKLAQMERDKAWSGMARQVAHEIKNPLTPMKLQLQRIIRLKQKNDPSWQEKFDEMSKVILEHIEILTDTANEFSTFAKLYAEDPVEIDLDALLSEEVSMYDSRSDVSFEYFGLPGVKIRGPKPQLTRVFVNLINNAVQAVEGTDDARVRVSLRKSSEDGWFDIVVEDSGSGVTEENLDKLFTPNFTTKNGGSGLGLAISRSILDNCGATIGYSRSFALSGACFTVKYPECPADGTE